MATATITDELTCPICLEFYKDPRVLPCQHSLCKSCLVALISKKEKDSNCDIQCPCCRYVFHATNGTYIDDLPQKFTLVSIVCKFQSSLQGDTFFPCDLCDEDQKGRAIKKCLQCQLHYCKMCMEQLHPKRGALANHMLVHIGDALKEEEVHGEPKSAFSFQLSDKSISTPECDQLIQERYCLSCDIRFYNGDQTTAVGSHENHDSTEIQTAFRRKRKEFHRTFARLLEEDMELEKGMATITNQIETVRYYIKSEAAETLTRPHNRSAQLLN